MLRQSFFHIEEGHPIYSNMDHFDRLIEGFYLDLFEQVWNLSQQSHLTRALTLHENWNAHDDLKTFGGYAFEVESRFTDVSNKGSCVGVLTLNDQTYRRFQERKVDHQELTQSIVSPPPCILPFSKSRYGRA